MKAVGHSMNPVDLDAEYRVLFEHLPQPAWVCDAESLQFLEVNREAVSKYGYAGDEFRRMTVADILPAESVTDFLKAIAVTASGPVQAGIWRHRIKDGTIIEVDIVVTDVTFQGRQARLAVATDVTGRRESEEKLKIYRHMFAHYGDGIAVIDQQGRYLEQNQAHARLIGYSDDELRNRTPAVHLGEEVFGRIAAELTERGSYRGEVLARTKSGATLHLDLAAFRVLNETGEIVCHVGIKRDITERKRVEAERERLVHQLEAERARLEKIQKELQEKIMDLERFEEVVVGRELKMIAMEKELEDLKKGHTEGE